jgi:hypothetical protein
VVGPGSGAKPREVLIGYIALGASGPVEAMVL